MIGGELEKDELEWLESEEKEGEKVKNKLVDGKEGWEDRIGGKDEGKRIRWKDREECIENGGKMIEKLKEIEDWEE